MEALGWMQLDNRDERGANLKREGIARCMQRYEGSKIDKPCPCPRPGFYIIYCHFLPQQTALSELCEEILDMCCSRTVEKFGRNACDNMTIIIVVFDIVSLI